MQNISFSFVLFSAFFFLTSFASGKVSSAKKLTDALNATVDKALQEKRVVGTVVLISRDGKIIYEKAAGYADRENKQLMKTDSVFRLSSMTKPIVSVTALALVDQGKIKLDDPVTKWYPDFKPKTNAGDSPAITVRHLLTHTAGLNYGFLEEKTGPYHKAQVSDGLDLAGISLDENIKRIATVPLLFAPGTGWQYSVSTDILGGVLEKAMGLSLPEIVQKNVTGPLQMKDTSFVATELQRLAVPYIDGYPQPTRMMDRQEVPMGNGFVLFSPGRALDRTAFPSGGAGMVGTATDYMKFLETVRKDGAPLLKTSTQKLLMTNQVGDIPVSAVGPGWGWTLGFAILKDATAAKSVQTAGTVQWGGVYGHSWWIDPKEKLTVIILTNTTLEGMSGKFPADIKTAIYKNLK